MSIYIDGFVLPIPKFHLNEYKRVAETVADIWREHGAIEYYEFVGDDLSLEGTQSFTELLNTNEEEAIIFGWVVFESKKVRDRVNKLVASDPRMTELIEPLTDPARMIFNAGRMAYGGFKPLI